MFQPSKAVQSSEPSTVFISQGVGEFISQELANCVRSPGLAMSQDVASQFPYLEPYLENLLRESHI